MKQWLRQGYEPVNFEVEIAKIIHKINLDKQAKVEFQERLAQCDTYNIIKQRIQKISEICKQYDIPDVTKKKIVLKDRILFDQFVHDVEFPFLDYKRGSSIDRVLQKCKYKEKDQDSKY